MHFSPESLVPVSEARARLTELAEDAVAGNERPLTKNGEAYVALIDAKKLAYYHRLEEREAGRRLLMEDAVRGLEDAKNGRVLTLEELEASARQRRSARA